MHKHFIEQCTERGICPEYASSYGHYSSRPSDIAKFLGWRSWEFPVGAILFYANGQPFQARPTMPVQKENWVKSAKYITAAQAHREEVVMPSIECEPFGGGHLLVTEGPFKVIALGQCGYQAIGLAGVENFHEAGEVTMWETLRPVFRKRDRVTLLFDADILYKPMVRRALLKLYDCIKDYSATVDVAIPTAGKGIDDHLAETGEAGVHQVISDAVSIDRFIGKPLMFREGQRLATYMEIINA